MHDFVADIHRSAVRLKGFFDNQYGTVNASTKATWGRKE
jgi:hypothetical protein